MIHQNLQLAAVLDAAGAAVVARALRAITGVNEVGASEGSHRVAVAYDDNRTSPQEIGAVLARAGYPLREPAKAGGGCCGGCGGGGH